MRFFVVLFATINFDEKKKKVARNLCFKLKVRFKLFSMISSIFLFYKLLIVAFVFFFKKVVVLLFLGDVLFWGNNILRHNVWSYFGFCCLSVFCLLATTQRKQKRLLNPNAIEVSCTFLNFSFFIFSLFIIFGYYNFQYIIFFARNLFLFKFFSFHRFFFFFFIKIYL